MKVIISIIILVIYFNGFSQIGEKRIALVIGNSTYQNGSILKNPVNDADLMEITLRELGFSVYKSTNASKNKMQQDIDDFKIQLPKYNVCLFYYAGHGMEINGKNYLIPIDARNDNENNVRIGSVDVSSIVEEFENYSKNVNIIILDACRNNPFLSSQRGGGRGFKIIPAPSGTIIAFATAPGATAQDGNGKNGLYTSELVKEIKKPQRIEDVFINTRNAILNINANQNPQEWSQLRSVFYFKRGSENIKVEENIVFDPGKVNNDYGIISLKSEIEGTLYLDGKAMGTVKVGTEGAKLNNVAVGNHTLSIRGNEDWSEAFVINKNQTTFISAKSKKNNNLVNMLNDGRDKKYYKTVKIGNQIWMAENLAYYAGNGCWAYDNIVSNVGKYGYLYEWKVAKNICPSGWRMPTKNDFEILLNNFGSSNKDAYNALVKGGASGFSAYYGGKRDQFGNFTYEFDNANFWSSSEGTTSSGYYLYFYNGGKYAYIDYTYKAEGFSVRCIKDDY